MICTYCKKPIIDYRNSKIAYFSNVASGEQYFFCNPTCKKAWLAERLKKTEESEQEVFICQYCNSEWDSSRSREQHERHCIKNPESAAANRKVYTIEEIREIDRVFKLTDKQIAKFVRSGRWVKRQ